jgi:hypothetical protein
VLIGENLLTIFGEAMVLAFIYAIVPGLASDLGEFSWLLGPPLMNFS